MSESPGSRSAPTGSTRASKCSRHTVLPALEELEGCCSASLLVDRASGRAVSSAAYDSVEAMERNRDQLDKLRASASQEANAQVLEEREFELAIAHLRVPEMA